MVTDLIRHNSIFITINNSHAICSETHIYSRGLISLDYLLVYLRSSPSSSKFWHLRDILRDPRTITQSDVLTCSSYQRGTLGEISSVFHMSILGSINSVELRTVPKQCNTWLHFSQHLVCKIKTRFLPATYKIKKKLRHNYCKIFIHLDYYTRLSGDRQPFTSKIRTLKEARVHNTVYNEQKHYYSFSKA